MEVTEIPVIPRPGPAPLIYFALTPLGSIQYEELLVSLQPVELTI